MKAKTPQELKKLELKKRHEHLSRQVLLLMLQRLEKPQHWCKKELAIFPPHYKDKQEELDGVEKHCHRRVLSEYASRVCMIGAIGVSRYRLEREGAFVNAGESHKVHNQVVDLLEQAITQHRVKTPKYHGTYGPSGHYVNIEDFNDDENTRLVDVHQVINRALSQC